MIGMIDGINRIAPQNKRQFVIEFALDFHNGELKELPSSPAALAKRFGVEINLVVQTDAARRLENWGDRRLTEIGQRDGKDTVRNAVSRIIKTMERYQDDPIAARWRWYIGSAWASLIAAPNFNAVRGWTAEAGEVAYFEEVMLPFFRRRLFALTS